MSRMDSVFAVLPDPGEVRTLDALVDGLRALKVWAGGPSYETITDRINTRWRTTGRPRAELARRATVADCFKPGRRRVNTDLVIAVVQALHPEPGYVAQWQQALRVIAGETGAAAQVRVQAVLPDDLAAFTGRTLELARVATALADPRTGEAAVIAGMAGAGKTQLAVHAGHRFARDHPLDRVLFVNLRGFHPDPAQPPADPAAVLDGFLRLLGLPGPQIPHGLGARAAAFRARLTGTRTLVILDNAATEEQIAPLLPATPGCPVLITSRRSLTAPTAAMHLGMDAFVPAEALAFLAGSAIGIPAGPDPGAAARIARRCGYLPLALSLVAGHLHGTTGWTLTDHADRLDERHLQRRLDSGVELALDLSYRRLSPSLSRLLRLAATHPGHDFDAYAAAALAGVDLAVARAGLAELHRDHLLHRTGPDRYTFHDLVRAYAGARSADEDAPPERRAATTRLADFYLSAAAAAMTTLHPASVPSVPGPVVPDLTDPEVARGWLDTERPTLIAVAAWQHATRLSVVLYRYLDGGHTADALALHGYALDAALAAGDRNGQAHALTGLGTVHLRLGRYEPAAGYLTESLALFRATADVRGEALALGTLGIVEKRLGRYQSATAHFAQALELHRRTGDRAGEARALNNLGVVETRLGRYPPAARHLRDALTRCRTAGDRTGEADALKNLSDVAGRIGRHRLAATRLERAIALYREVGDRASEAATLDELGIVNTRLGKPALAVAQHERALTVFRETGDRDAETWALNGLGEAAAAAGQPADAFARHEAAHAIAEEIGSRDQQARAHAGLGQAYAALGRPEQARRHFSSALTLYVELGMPEADRIRAVVAAL